MNEENLKKIIEDHGKWRRNEPGGVRADLSDADLRGAINGSVCRMDFGGWSICIRSTETSIGCQKKPNSFWLSATPHDVSPMALDADTWWAVHGPAVCAAIRVVMEKAK